MQNYRTGASHAQRKLPFITVSFIFEPDLYELEPRNRCIIGLQFFFYFFTFFTFSTLGATLLALLLSAAPVHTFLTLLVPR